MQNYLKHPTPPYFLLDAECELIAQQPATAQDWSMFYCY